MWTVCPRWKVASCVWFSSPILSPHFCPRYCLQTWNSHTCGSQFLKRKSRMTDTFQENRLAHSHSWALRPLPRTLSISLHTGACAQRGPRPPVSGPASWMDAEMVTDAPSPGGRVRMCEAMGPTVQLLPAGRSLHPVAAAASPQTCPVACPAGLEGRSVGSGLGQARYRVLVLCAP